MHTHAFKGVTTYIDGHLHLFSGVSSASPDVPGHTHYITGTTTISNGHSHSFNLITHTQTNVNSGHYHYYQGDTAIVLGHSHPMESTTFVLGE
ncbi:MAG: YmaF family protein [Bacillota bacterium]